MSTLIDMLSGLLVKQITRLPEDVVYSKTLARDIGVLHRPQLRL